ncbi:39S ribosomal protein L37, mitochondrial-like [Uloborus diversus]|uniref:39S ribosomal protein L37, mitochondrial-like n=1 Tax=Uloborus diversus TaxID=327109 RepID=UPI00240A4D00|nr:39S ribosomal protein L37, mitochondrial-like [Uloborus diversus]
MRLTSVLRQINYHRHFKRVWARQGKLQAPELVIPPELIEMKVEIKDGKSFLKETQGLKKSASIKVIPKPPCVFEKKKVTYLMHNKTKVSESENQILALTKTVCYRGLPEQLTGLLNAESFPNQDELVQKSVLQAQVWDATQDKLPKVVDVTRPGLPQRRVYGIRYKKKVSSLLENLSVLCDIATGKYPGSLERFKLTECSSELTIDRCGDQVIFQLPCEIAMTSTSPLKRFSSKDEVNETVNLEVPSIYPIKPTLDLEQLEQSSLERSGVPIVLDSDHLHTLFLGQKSFGYWNPRQMLAKAIGTCFAYTASVAQDKYGLDVKVLPEPIMVQCMYLDIKTFNFLTYQLNTLELADNNGIKNQVWVDEPADLYESVSQDSLVTNYNPAVFPKMLALHMNGLHP